MKNKNIYVLIIFLFCILGCQESFLDETPTDELTTETYYTTEEDFETAITGVYGIFCTWRQYMEFVPMIDMATPAAVHGSSRYGQWHWGNSGFTPDDLTTSHLVYKYWQKWWLGIGRANEVLYRIEENGDDVFTTEGLEDRIKGEALFLRALFYFHLTYIWGDLPLQTEPTGGDSYFPSKVDQSKIVEQIESDLTKAIDLLPSVTEYRGTDDMGRASRGAAKALLGKTYCFEEDWENATTILADLIDDGDYELTSGSTGFNDQFWEEGENGEESIFEIQYASGLDDQYNNAFVTYCAISGTGITTVSGDGYGYIQPTDWMVDKFETVNGYDVSSNYDSTKTDGSYAFSYSSDDPDFNPDSAFDNRDPRLKWTAMYEGSSYLSEKWPDNTFAASSPDESNFSTVKYIVDQSSMYGSGMNLVVLRYADVLLLYAEALMEQNELSEAASYVNMVRSRGSVNMPDVPSDVSSDQSSLREYIHDERIRELAFEYGHVFFDLRRWYGDGDYNYKGGLWVEEMTDYWTANKLGHDCDAIDIDDHNILFPIPQDEIDLNPNLEQNDGY